MAEKKIAWITEPKKHYFLETVSKSLKFAFLSEDYRQCMEFVYCRDYLQDVVYSQLHDKPLSLFGLRWSPENGPIATSRTLLAIANPDDDLLAKRVPRMLTFLHQIEKKLKFRKTKLYEVNPPPRCKPHQAWVLDGSKQWLISPPMISLYSLLIKTGMVHHKNCKYSTTINAVIEGKRQPYHKVDKARLRWAVQGIEKIVKDGTRIFYPDIKLNYPSSLKPSIIHSQLGIVGFSTKRSLSHIPFWHRG